MDIGIKATKSRIGLKREYWSYQANLVARKVFSKINKKYCMVQTCKNKGWLMVRYQYVTSIEEN